MSEWKECVLDDVADIIPGYAFKGEDFGDEGTTIIKIKDITPPIVNISEAQKIVLSKYSIDKLQKFKLKKGDFVVAMTGATIGKVGKFHGSADAYINQRVSKIQPKLNVIHDFVYYAVLNNNFYGFIQNNIDSHSAQENISSSSIGRYPMVLPPLLAEQRTIVRVLSSFDDKIDLLHRQNKTLESLAETLFRQWFVEEAGSDWKEGEIGDFVTIKGGTTPSTKEPDFWDGDVCWTSPRDLSTHSAVFMFDTERKITEKGLVQISSGQMPIGTVLMSSRAPIGYLAITNIPTAINQGYIAIVCDKTFSNYFMYLWCKANMEQIKSAGNGSTFEEISKSSFKKLSVLVPDDKELKVFHTIVTPLFEKIKTNQQQINLLETLRDTLLPKLMAGKIKVTW